MDMDPNFWFHINEILNDDLDIQHLLNNLNELPSPDESTHLDLDTDINELFATTDDFMPEFGEEYIDFDVPDLSDLPLEDFVDLENLVEELDCSDQSNSFGCLNGNKKEEASYEYDQNSPLCEEETQLAYKELLDAFDEEEFINSLNHLTKSSEKLNEESCSDVSVKDAPVYSVADTETTLSSDDIIPSNHLALSEDVAPINGGIICDKQETDSVTNEILKLLQEQYGIDFNVPVAQENNNVNKSNKRKYEEIDNVEYSKKPKCEIEEIDKFDKTTQRRMKNNEASKVTRARRKAKQKELFEKEKKLEKHNAELKIKIESMQKEATVLRDMLITKLSGAKVEST